MPTWPNVLSAVLRGEQLAVDDAAWAMNEIMTGEATPAQVAGFAMALRAKGETAEEVGGLVRAMLSHALRVRVSGRAVDTCGTGGDRANTVNISTMAAIVVAGAGVTVVKHGNRAASSASGSADLLEALGVVVDLPAEGVERCLDEVGIGFCFAPVFHPGFRHTAVPRRELGVPTVFNFLGPLTNPAQPQAQAVGVADERMAPVVAGVLAARGASAVVFRGEDGLDELSTVAPSKVWVVHDGDVRLDRIDAAELGIAVARPDDLRGGDAEHNAVVARRVLDGEPGPARDAVVLNAAAALVAHAGTATTPITRQLEAMLPRAEQAIDSGAAAESLSRWAAVSQTLR